MEQGDPTRIAGMFLTEPEQEDEEVAPHDGEDEPDAHPEPDPLGEEEGCPEQADEADEPEEEQGSQGTQEINPLIR